MSFRFKRIAAVAAVLVAVVTSAGSAQYFGRNKIQYKDHKWHILSTPHFDIHYYEGGEAFAVRAGLVLEDGYQMLSTKLREVLSWRVPVILYASHQDFLHTNIDPRIIGEGVQAFAEPRRRRIVVPFTSSFKEFEHTAIHELAHIFTFQIIYNRMLDNVFTRSYLPGMPLWVAEGVAEYLSVGWDTDSDMYIRDAVIHDYLIPFYGVGGFYVYKEGQSVFNYMAETYGHEKVLEFLDALAATRSAGAALQRTIGVGEEQLHVSWSKALRKHYWPLYPDKTEVAELGRQLTNHIKDHGYYNTKPILSPDGEKVAFFSDRSGLVEILVASALDGKIIDKVVTGSRSNRYESLHFLTSAMCWDPQGERVAFVAKSGGHDAIFIKNVETGSEQQIEVESDGMAAPAWSPVADEIVVSAVFAGQTDLVVVNVADGTSRRLTSDPADNLTPRFFPDGKRIVFVHYPEVTIPVPDDFLGRNRDVLSEMDFLDADNVLRHADYDIWEYDLATNRQRALVATPGDDTEPFVLSDGKTIVFASDLSGINNLHAIDMETGDSYRFTDVLGGLFTPSVNEEKGRIAFSAFVRGGHDVFVSDDLQSLMARRYADHSPRVLAHSAATAREDLREADEAQGPAEAAPGALAAADSAQVASVSGDGEAPPQEEKTGTASVDSYVPEIRPITTPRDAEGADASAQKKKPAVGIAEGLPGEDPPRKGATVTPYRTRLAPDFIGQGGGLYFSTGFGFGISNSIAMSDMLGDHYAMFAFNLYRNIEESDFLLTYSYVKKRIDYSVGLFQFKSFLDSRTSTLGEGFSSYQLFSERNYGIFALMSIPFNMFYRMDIELQSYISDRTFFQRTNDLGVYAPTGESKRRLFEPSVAFIHDSSFFGPFGPVEGSRWRVSVARAVAAESRDVSRLTLWGDYRWYKSIFFRNAIAFRALSAMSEGKDPRVFFLGGPTTLRGYDYLQFEGTKMAMASFEYRFPLIDALILGWPGRWGFTNIGGSVFFDVGAIWDRHDPVFLDNQNGTLRFQDTVSDVGFGWYMYFGYFLLNFQFAWPTDLQEFSRDYQFHFYMGPTF